MTGVKLVSAMMSAFASGMFFILFVAAITKSISIGFAVTGLVAGLLIFVVSVAFFLIDKYGKD